MLVTGHKPNTRQLAEGTEPLTAGFISLRPVGLGNEVNHPRLNREILKKYDGFMQISITHIHESRTTISYRLIKGALKISLE
jgi:hypothetical protein